MIIAKSKKMSIKNEQELKERLVLKETEKVWYNNLKSILKNELLANTGAFRDSFLTRHKIDKDIRTKMVDWMIEVLSSFNCDHNTFFVSVNIMDSFLSKSPNIYQSKDIHLIGVTSMLIASKMEEVLPFKISTVVEKMTHGKIRAD
jgi:hypothetical protein